MRTTTENPSPAIAGENQMRAVVVHGPGDVRIEERARPVPEAGEVLLALEWGGICGSDISYWKKGASGTASLTHPLVLGHEFAGAGSLPSAAMSPASAKANPSPCTRPD